MSSKVKFHDRTAAFINGRHLHSQYGGCEQNVYGSVVYTVMSPTQSHTINPTKAGTQDVRE